MKRLKNILVAALLGVGSFAASLTAVASPIISVAELTGSTTVIDFSQFTGLGQQFGVNGPVQIGAVAGVDVVAQDMSSGANIWLYNDVWGLGDNGLWNAGRNGFLGIFPGSGPVRITFNDGPVSGFGLFMNYPVEGGQDFLPQILAAYDSLGNLLEMFDVSATAPIATLDAINDGGFRGIQLATANIAYFELLGNTAAYDDLTFTRATSIPEPATLALLGLGLLGFGAARRKKA